VKRTLRGGALRVFAAPWCRLAAQRSSPLSTSGAAAPRKPAAPGGPGGRCCGLRKEESGASGRRSLGPPEGVWGLARGGAWRGAFRRCSGQLCTGPSHIFGGLGKHGGPLVAIHAVRESGMAGLQHLG
jgi:hypothetical protein